MSLPEGQTRTRTMDKNKESAILKLKDVKVRFHRPGREILKAVDGVNLELAPGEVLGLVGESGCGKSTLARAICGLEPLAGGEILFQDERIKPLGLKKRPARYMGIQMVFQNPYASLNPRRKIGEQIADGLALNTRKDKPTVADLLEAVELEASAAQRYSHAFSGGQRQRIAIARAIAADPAVLIGDEPIASLDASLQSRIAKLMKTLSERSGSALLFITHDLAVVREIAHRIAVMKAGQIVEIASASSIWTNPRHPYTQRLLASIPIADGLGRLPEVLK